MVNLSSDENVFRTWEDVVWLAIILIDLTGETLDSMSVVVLNVLEGVFFTHNHSQIMSKSKEKWGQSQ